MVSFCTYLENSSVHLKMMALLRIEDPSCLLNELRKYWCQIRITPASHHAKQVILFLRSLKIALSHSRFPCEWRSQDTPSTPSTPIRVLARDDKTFTLKVKDQRQPVKVSVDRIKLALFLTDLGDDKPTVHLGLCEVS